MLIPERSVMLDVESEGTDPHRHNLIQIGAVEFDQDFRILRSFSVFPRESYARRKDPDSVRWWKGTAPDLYERILARCAIGPHPTEAIMRFFDWLPDKPAVWAWPATFDVTFVRSYAKQFGRNEPSLIDFLLFREVDVKSWVMGLLAGSGSGLTYDDFDTREPPPFEGEEHDAEYDARWQVWLLKRLVEKVRSGWFYKDEEGS